MATELDQRDRALVRAVEPEEAAVEAVDVRAAHRRQAPEECVSAPTAARGLNTSVVFPAIDKNVPSAEPP